jgi:hypothetical protein
MAVNPAEAVLAGDRHDELALLIFSFLDAPSLGAFSQVTRKTWRLSRALRRVEFVLGAGRNFRSVVVARPVAKTVVIRSSSARLDGRAGMYLQQMLGAVLQFKHLAEVRLDLSRLHIEGAFKYLMGPKKDTSKLSTVRRASLTLGRSKCGGATPLNEHTMMYLGLVDKMFQHATELDLPEVCATQSLVTGISNALRHLKKLHLGRCTSRCAIDALADCDQLESLTLRFGNPYAQLYGLGGSATMPSFSSAWRQWCAFEQLASLLEKLPRLRAFRLDGTHANYGHGRDVLPTVLFPRVMPEALVDVTFFRCYHWQDFKSLLAHFGPRVTFTTDTGTLPDFKFAELPPDARKQVRFM